ncbi:PTH1 family peptidyl-tRNA hydrolase [Thermoflavifilum aggregans]|uniref:Peptidyl-tRNA hydrolase n=1 Tax=Thermoflavifilum aggregans TaxID=454188 RepID=A0A2M9CTH2_9BACT|nr:aminoacyl-tRNA hydrolase [Thermoflavifilum aggregans]MBX6380715.1 aminoacyl-tRNA hydrolase [Thermoflavifilum aggregans]PJJ75220.1 PTH1 family peptidyl-tRNA hydrolase [Thermoflavifilum aggregans]
MKYLLVGIGNVGEAYVHTRHNIGFDVLDAFAARHDMVFRPDRYADRAEGRWKGKQLILIKPTTYVNLSGKAVKYWMDKEKIPLEQLLVVVDDIALPLDTVRLRPGGSDGGHNGLKHIEEMLGTRQFARLRFGIGQHFPKGQQVEYVLGKWKPEEWEIVQKKISLCVDILESFISRGIEATMNDFNARKIKLENGSPS